MLLDSGVDKETVMAGGKTLEKAIDEGSEKTFKEFVMASKYYAFVMKRRDILTEGTVDEKIMKALADKDSTQSALIDAVKAEL